MMKRVYIFLIFVGIFSLIFQLGTMTSVDPEEAKMFLEEFDSLVEGIDAVGIFLHNTTIALPMFLPGFGIAWGLFSAWSTGYAFAAITTVTPALLEIPPLTILFFSPFGLMELSAYALGISRSCILTVSLIRREPIRTQARDTAIEIGVMVGLLLAGGFIEFQMIEELRTGNLNMPGL